MRAALLGLRAGLHLADLVRRLRAFRDQYQNRLKVLEYLKVLWFRHLIDIHLRHFEKEF